MKPDYGIDAPNVIRNFILLGCATLIASHWLPGRLSSLALWWGAISILESLLMIIYAKAGKFRHRDRILALVAWRGDEWVLDIGTGRGLLMIGAAKKITNGKAVGIDIWNREDLSGNGPRSAMENARIENVASKIEIKTEDAQKMNFPDASFDVIVSNLALHNIPNMQGRTAACSEIVRVLRPGGQALISDFRHTKDYAATFRTAGLKTKINGPYILSTFPPLSIVMAEKA